MNFLASPPLVVAYALAGTVDIDLTRDPHRARRAGKPVYLRDIWPTAARDPAVHRPRASLPPCSRRPMPTCSTATSAGAASRLPESKTYVWDARSTYIQNPPYFDGMDQQATRPADRARRALPRPVRRLDHDRPHLPGGRDQEGRAGRASTCSHTVSCPADFNSYGSRRGNHEVMMRGTFANTRIKNLMVPGVEGGVTALPAGRREACRSTMRR